MKATRYQRESISTSSTILIENGDPIIVCSMHVYWNSSGGLQFPLEDASGNRLMEIQRRSSTSPLIVTIFKTSWIADRGLRVGLANSSGGEITIFYKLSG